MHERGLWPAKNLSGHCCAMPCRSVDRRDIGDK
jgi:hypothetical protein